MQVQKPEEDSEIVSLLKEESDNLRAKVIQLTEKNTKLQKETDRVRLECERDKQYQIGLYTATIEKQKQEISKLMDAQYELNEIKGQQMLLAYEGKASIPDQNKISMQDHVAKEAVD